METLNYIFWKLTRYRLKKDGFDVTYFFATLLLGLFILFFPILVASKGTLVFEYVQKLSKGMKYLYFIPAVLLTSLPFRMLFPKEKIKNLDFSVEEKKNYNKKTLFGFIFFILLLIIRVIYVKFYKYQ